MSTVRIDPLTGEPVVISPRRIPAPPAFGPGRLPQVATCPFCPGNEGVTGKTIAEVRGEAGWLARVFPNRRPALRPEEPDHPLCRGVLHGHSGVGAHEVIAESPDHAAVGISSAAMQLAADRLEDLRHDRRFAAVTWFRNRGVEAGSSQPHPHSQIIALPVVPGRLQAVVSSQQAHPGLFGELLSRAAEERRVVWEGEGVVGFCPWAPATPFEVWFAPTGPVPWLSLDRARVDALSEGLTEIDSRLNQAFGFCSHNSVLFDAPNREAPAGFAWHVRVQPRLVGIAGFERWSGGGMHPITPEHAAAVLRGFVT